MMSSAALRTDPGPVGGDRLEFARDVRCGLLRPGQKELPSKYFYDDLGTTLFEAITQLPEYGLTRADERVVRAHAGDLAAQLNVRPAALAVVELGSGGGRKTRPLLEALAGWQPVNYYPVDVSRAALERCRQEVEEFASVHPLHCSYLAGLREASSRRPPGGRLLVLFLGSNIGNFERDAAQRFLHDLRRETVAGDALLLGTDLVKPAAQLLAAYDDPTGVTAAFNRNLLGRINRELEGDFDLNCFEHLARYDSVARRIEMHLRSTTDQCISIPKAGVEIELRRDETIWTESSHKYTTGEVTGMASEAGFACQAQWVDREWPFAESLLVARSE